MALWTGASFQNMVNRHQMTIEKYPHIGLDKGAPYGGIENLRPETLEVIEKFNSWHQAGKQPILKMSGDRERTTSAKLLVIVE